MAFVDLDDRQLILLAQLCERHVEKLPELAQNDVRALARLLRMARKNDEKGSK